MSSRIDRDVLGACKGSVAECSVSPSGAVLKASLTRFEKVEVLPNGTVYSAR